MNTSCQRVTGGAHERPKAVMPLRKLPNASLAATIRRLTNHSVLACLLLIAAVSQNGWSGAPQSGYSLWNPFKHHAGVNHKASRKSQNKKRKKKEQLTQMSLSELGNLKVT